MSCLYGLLCIWRSRAPADSSKTALIMWFMKGSWNYMVSAQTWEDLVPEASHVGSWPCHWGCRINSEHHVSGEPPWLAVLRAYCHQWYWVSSHCQWLSWGKAPGGSLCEALPGSASPFARLNLFPFTVLNPNHEHKCFQWLLWVV